MALRIAQVLCFLGSLGGLNAYIFQNATPSTKIQTSNQTPNDIKKSPSDNRQQDSEKQSQVEQLVINARYGFEININALRMGVVSRINGRDFAIRRLPPKEDRAAKGTLTSHPAAGLISLEPIHDRSERVDDRRVSAAERHLAPAVWIEIVDSRTGRFDAAMSDRAAQEVVQSFSVAAAGVLSKVTDTTAPSWHDILDTVCRAHQRKASLVLPAPYFEDTEYCIRLIQSDSSSGYKFSLLAAASVSVAKNPGSGYRDPSKDEITPYGEILIKLTGDIESGLATSANHSGWRVTETGQGIKIDGRTTSTK